MIEMTIDSIRMSLMNYQRVVILREKEAERYLPIWIGPAEADAIAVKLQDVTVPRPLTHDLLRNVVDAMGAMVTSIIVCELRNDTFYAKIAFQLDNEEMVADVSFHGESGYESVFFYWRGRKREGKIIFDGVSNELGGRLLGLVADNGLELQLRYDEALDQWLVTDVKFDSRPSDAIALAVRLKVPIYAEEAVLDKAGILLDKDSGKPIPFGREGKEQISEEELKQLSPFTDFIETLNLEDLDKDKS